MPKSSACAFLMLSILSTAASAQKINYELLPGPYSYSDGSGGTHDDYWKARVLNRKDGKVYDCTAVATFLGSRNPTTLNLSCSQVGFNGILMTGDNVVSIPNNLAPCVCNQLDFWQIDHSSGELQFCYSAPQFGGPNCARTQLP